MLAEYSPFLRPCICKIALLSIFLLFENVFLKTTGKRTLQYVQIRAEIYWAANADR
jgi:hypothetical protein